MYQYHVKWWYDSKVIDSHGLVAANNYTQAAARVSEQYGDIDIEELSLEALGDTENLIQYKDGVKDLKNMLES